MHQKLKMVQYMMMTFINSNSGAILQHVLIIKFLGPHELGPHELGPHELGPLSWAPMSWTPGPYSRVARPSG